MQEAMSSALAAGGVPSSAPPSAPSDRTPPVEEAPPSLGHGPSGHDEAGQEGAAAHHHHHPADPRVVVVPMGASAKERGHYLDVLERHRRRAEVTKGRGPRVRGRGR